MIVKELVAKLAKYPENTEVTVLDFKGDNKPPIVLYDENTKMITLFEL